MKMWRREKKENGELPSFLRDALTGLNNRMISVANFLQQKTNDYSGRKKKGMLLLFILVFITESSMVIIESVTHKNKISIVVSRIKPVPLQTFQKEAPIVTKEEFEKIQKFKKYVDSSIATAKGKETIDSILYDRPHLMDSVRLLMDLYLQQSKTFVK